MGKKSIIFAVLCAAFACGCTRPQSMDEPMTPRTIVDFGSNPDKEAVKSYEALRIRVNEQKSLLAPSEVRGDDRPGIIITPNLGATPVYTMDEEFGAAFDFDSDKLSPKYEKEMIAIADQVRDFRDVRVRIEGYTDAIGTDEYNYGLSTRRAKTVTDLFLDRGVKPGIMSYIGHGKKMPVATNDTAAGRAKNRRVEVYVFTYKGGS